MQERQLQLVNVAQRNIEVHPDGPESNFGAELRRLLDEHPDTALRFGGPGPGTEELRDRDWFRVGSLVLDEIGHVANFLDVVKAALTIVRKHASKGKSAARKPGSGVDARRLGPGKNAFIFRGLWLIFTIFKSPGM